MYYLDGQQGLTDEELNNNDEYAIGPTDDSEDILAEKRGGDMWKFRSGKRGGDLWKFRGGKRGGNSWKFRGGKRGDLWKFRGGKRAELWKFRGGKHNDNGNIYIIEQLYTGKHINNMHIVTLH